jgi:hypothetical protein
MELTGNKAVHGLSNCVTIAPLNLGSLFGLPAYYNVPIREVDTLPLDDDGFAIPGQATPSAIRRPPPMVCVPKFFDQCASADEAIAKMIDELTKPASIQIDGFDTMYRRLADALSLVLATKGDFVP